MYLRYLIWHLEWSLRCRCIGLFDHDEFLPKVWNIWHYLCGEILGYRQKVWKKNLSKETIILVFRRKSLFNMDAHQRRQKFRRFSLQSRKMNHFLSDSFKIQNPSVMSSTSTVSTASTTSMTNTSSRSSKSVRW